MIFSSVYFIITEVLFFIHVGDAFMIFIFFVLFGSQLVLLNYLITANMKSSNSAFSLAITFTLGVAILIPIGTKYLSFACDWTNSGGFLQQGNFLNIFMVVFGLDPFVIFSSTF